MHLMAMGIDNKKQDGLQDNCAVDDCCLLDSTCRISSGSHSCNLIHNHIDDRAEQQPSVHTALPIIRITTTIQSSSPSKLHSQLEQCDYHNSHSDHHSDLHHQSHNMHIDRSSQEHQSAPIPDSCNNTITFISNMNSTQTQTQTQPNIVPNLNHHHCFINTDNQLSWLRCHQTVANPSCDHHCNKHNHHHCHNLPNKQHNKLVTEQHTHHERYVTKSLTRPPATTITLPNQMFNSSKSFCYRSGSKSQLLAAMTPVFLLTSLLLLAVVDSVPLSTPGAGYDNCPPVNLIHRLTAPNGAPVNRYAQSQNQTQNCECTTILEGGWEITCYATNEDGISSRESSTPPSSRLSSVPKDFDFPDYNDFNVLITSFFIRYEAGRQLKITCDHGAPVFKPALFQGFGIESIGTFTISGCELPLTLPLSVILYRTFPKKTVKVVSTFADASYSINTTGHHNHALESVAPISTLYLLSPKSIGVQQLNTLLSDLDSLEQLTLSNFNLNDIDDYMIETMDDSSHHLPTVKEFDIDHRSLRIRRNATAHFDILSYTKRSTNNVTVPSIESRVDFEDESTISPYIETTTTTADIDDIMSAREDVTEFEKEANLTQTFPPLNYTKAVTRSQLIPPLTSNASIETTAANTTPKPMLTTKTTTTARPKFTSGPIMRYNEPSMTTEQSNNEEFTLPPLDIAENTNDINIENKPIFVLDENALNFARILPNLRTLRLRHFVKESTIPNVVFQIIKGLKKLEYLELDSNQLNQIPQNALAFAGSNLKKLYLYKNSIKEIHENAFSNLTRLEILDLSQNQLTQLEDYTLKPMKNLMYLSLKSNQLGWISEYTFQANSKLVSLDLSQNQQLEPLPSNLLNGLTNLANFSLAYCNMSQISTQIQQFFRNVPHLSVLDVKGNRLSNMTISGLFARNPNLMKIDLSSNRIVAISKDIFNSNSSQITEINLNKNQLTKLPENLFVNVRNLRKLSVANNRLTEIYPMTFNPLRMLEELNLSRNQITTLNNHHNNQLPFGLGGFLQKVNLAYNNLTNFESEIGSINWNLYLKISDFDLKNNKFSGILSVPIFTASTEESIEFDVSSNQFSSVNVTDLVSYLDHDLGIHSNSQDIRSFVTYVRMDNNPINCDCFLFPFLNYTKTTGTLFSKNQFNSILRKTSFIMDSTDKLTCAQPPALRDTSLNQLDLDKLVCPINDHRICPQDCTCTYRSIDESAIIDCDNAGLVELPKELELSRYYHIRVNDEDSTVEHVNSVMVFLRDNQIQSIEGLSSMLKWNNDHIAKPRLVEIYLDKNNVSQIEPDFLSEVNDTSESVPLLRILSLQNNAIRTVPLNVLQNFNNLACKLGFDGANSTKIRQLDNMGRLIEPKMFIGENPFDCYNEPMPLGSDCYVRDFKLWLSSHQSRVGDLNDIRCDEQSVYLQSIDSNTTYNIVNMNDDLLCPVLLPPPNNTALMALSIVCVLLASSLFVVSIFYYRNKQTILAFIYIHLNPVFICLSFTEDDLDEDKIYDAFVSYSSSDRDIVMELIEKLEKPQDMSEANLILQNGSSIHEGKIDQIVPENEFKKSSKDIDLEDPNDGETRYRLCIHERDWLPGNLISWNIVNSVQNSKRTILVLSPSFIKSIWFQVEFHTAYYQMLEDKMDRLIVIVRGELPPKEELDKDLNFLLTTKTYLVWGEKWFWEKLYYAMPHKKQQKGPPGIGQKGGKFDMNGTLTKTNGSTLKNGGGLNGVNYKDGMLKWSSSYNSHNHHLNHSSLTKPNGKTEVMKDYVDKTIASHFQLDSFPPSSPVVISNQPMATTMTNQSSNHLNDHQKSTKQAPKSLRNSGTLSTATPTTLQALSMSTNGAYENKSFIRETNT